MRRIALCRLPAFYGQKFQRRVKAGAACEDLRVRCPHFYEVGCSLHDRLDSPELGAFLQSTFSERYRVLALLCALAMQGSSTCGS